MTNEYPKYEIEWKKVFDNKGEQVFSKDGAAIVTSGELLLTPKLLASSGNWVLTDTASGIDVEGYWNPPRRATQVQLAVDVPALVTLQLGGTKNDGSRYRDITDVKAAPAGVAQPATESVQEAVSRLQAQPAPTSPQLLTVGIDRDSSIREQAFYNHLNPELLRQLPAEQQEALLGAWFDTAMLMLRPSVRKRAIDILQREPDVKEIEASPPVEQKITEINADEDVTQLPW
jgi:hypothetical protein